MRLLARNSAEVATASVIGDASDVTTTTTTMPRPAVCATAKSATSATSAADGPRDALKAALAARVAALPRATREELRELAAGVDWLLKMGRSIRLLPVLFVVLWPILFPWLVARLVRLHRLQQDPVVRALLDDSAPIRRSQIQDRGFDDDDLADLVHVREGVAVTGYSVVGPPLILCGFALAVVVAGR